IHITDLDSMFICREVSSNNRDNHRFLLGMFPSLLHTQINLDAWKDCRAQHSSLPFKKEKTPAERTLPTREGGHGQREREVLMDFSGWQCGDWNEMGGTSILSLCPTPSSPQICTCSSLGPLTGGLLISEVMENGPRHTPQIGSDCLGVK
ncbi:hypothetical protein KUCAC02_025468, partial [Chaenocephalus aceratus]